MKYFFQKITGVFVLAFMLIAIIGHVNAQPDNNAGDDHTKFTATAGELTWIGRMPSDNLYEVVKVDAADNETVVYQTVFTPYSDVLWKFSNLGRNLVITAVRAAADAADSTQIAFINGEEMIRSNSSTYGEELTFKTPDSPLYTVTFVTSATCGGMINSENSQSETELLGVKISSEEGSEIFNLPEPEVVPCAVHDDLFVNRHPEDVDTNPYGISFRLPTRDKAGILIDDMTQKVTVNFESAETFY